MDETVVNKLENEEGIDIAEILQALLSKIVWILLAAVIFAAGAFAYTKLAVTPVYNSTITIYFNHDNMSSAGDITIATYSAEDYAKLIKKRPVLERVIAGLGLDMTYAQLASCVDVSIEEQSRVLDIIVTNTDPAMAKKIADRLAIETKEMMEAQTQDERVIIWGDANLPTSPVSPSAVRNAILAAAVGLILASAVVVVIHLYDDKLRTAENIEKALGLTVLASIPSQQVEEEENAAAKSDSDESAEDTEAEKEDA